MSRSARTTIRQSVERAVGDEPIDRVLYRRRLGALDDPEFAWEEHGSVSDLPGEPLDGWEELLVFTADHVYRWVETGYSRGPTVLPREPEAILPEPSLGVE